MQIDRIGRVVLDLAAKTVDLHVDGSFTHFRFRFHQFVAWNGVAGAQCKKQHDLLFAICQADRFWAAPQFLLRNGEAVGTKHDLFDLGRIWRGVAPQDVVDAQDEFARIEGLGEIVVRARFQPGNARIRLRTGGQKDDRHGFVLVQRAGQRKPVFARHHHVEDEQIEADAYHFTPCFGRIGCHGDAVTLVAKEALQEIANAGVVVDDQEMGRIVIRWRSFCRSLRHRHSPSTFVGLRICARNLRTQARASGPSPSSARSMRRDCGSLSASASSRPVSVG
ncbi:hypothetical protein D3C78_962720 [compost metagenome]